jgi:hypothetical protein
MAVSSSRGRAAAAVATVGMHLVAVWVADFLPDPLGCGGFAGGCSCLKVGAACGAEVIILLLLLLLLSAVTDGITVGVSGVNAAVGRRGSSSCCDNELSSTDWAVDDHTNICRCQGDLLQQEASVGFRGVIIV